MVNIKLLFIILDKGYSKRVTFMLNRFGIKLKVISGANGTASPSVLDYFGLTEVEKEVYMSVIPDYLEDKIIEKFNEVFHFKKEGAGILFTIPISSSNKFVSDNFSVDEIKGVDEKVDNKIKYHLVITIVLEGYLEQVMAAAKRAGCSGGTVIKGRGLSNNNPAKILGFNIEPERDVVFNIVKEEDKTKVMEEITKEVGIKTKGKGVCIALPVDSAIGLDMYE